MFLIINPKEGPAKLGGRGSTLKALEIEDSRPISIVGLLVRIQLGLFDELDPAKARTTAVCTACLSVHGQRGRTREVLSRGSYAVST